eukprot:PhF_6_TR967/c0_g1_i2/m.1843
MSTNSFVTFLSEAPPTPAPSPIVEGGATAEEPPSPITNVAQGVERLFTLLQQPVDAVIVFPQIVEDAETRKKVVEGLAAKALTSKGYSASHSFRLRAIAHGLNLKGTDVGTIEMTILDTMLTAGALPAVEKDRDYAVSNVTRPTNTKRVAVIVGVTAGVGYLGLCAGGFLLAPVLAPVFGVVAVSTTKTAIAASATAGVLKAGTIAACGLTGLSIGLYKSLTKHVGCHEFAITKLDLMNPITISSDCADAAAKVTEGVIVPIGTHCTTLTNIRRLSGAVDPLHQEGFAGFAIVNKCPEDLELVKCEIHGPGFWLREPLKNVPANKTMVCMVREPRWYKETNIEAPKTPTVFLAYKFGANALLVVAYTANPTVDQRKYNAIVFSAKEKWESIVARILLSAAALATYKSEEEPVPLPISHSASVYGTSDCIVTVEPRQETHIGEHIVTHDEGSTMCKDIYSKMTYRRYLIVRFSNTLNEDLTLVASQFPSGQGYSGYLVPKVIPADSTAVFVSVNNDYALTGTSLKVYYTTKAGVVLGLWADTSGPTGTLWSQIEVRSGEEAIPSKFTFAPPAVQCITDGSGNSTLMIQECEASTCTVSVTAYHKATIDTSSLKPLPHMNVVIPGLLLMHDVSKPTARQSEFSWAKVFQKDKNPAGTYAAETFMVEWESQSRLQFSTQGYEWAAKEVLLSQSTNLSATQSTPVQRQRGAFITNNTLPLSYAWLAKNMDETFTNLAYWAIDAGQQLASALYYNFHGGRPITLIATSVAGTAVLQCLQDLQYNKVDNVIENIILLGSTVPSNEEVWKSIRQAVPGRVINVFSSADNVLGFSSRGGISFSGTTPVRFVPGVENIDATKIVRTHADYDLRIDEIMALIPDKPTKESLGNVFPLPGLVVPCQWYISNAVHQLHYTDSRKNKITLYVENKGKDDITSVPSGVEDLGVWEYTPPPLTKPSEVGVMSVSNTDPAGAVRSTLLFQYGSKFIVFWITFTGGNEGKATVKGTLVASRPDPILLVKPPESDTDLIYESEGVVLTVKDDWYGVWRLTVSVTGDNDLTADHRVMEDIQAWSQTTTFNELAPPTDKTESLETPPTWRYDITHRLQVAFLNETKSTHLVFTSLECDEGACEWHHAPRSVIGPGQTAVGGIAPKVIYSSITGSASFQVIDSKTETVLGSGGVRWEQRWNNGTVTFSLAFVGGGKVPVVPKEGVAALPVELEGNDGVKCLAEVVPLRNALRVFIQRGTEHIPPNAENA